MTEIMGWDILNKLNQEENLNILGMFVKPQKLTEEEVSVAKEKKICLVCKNKLLRFDIYICPECSAYIAKIVREL